MSKPAPAKIRLVDCDVHHTVEKPDDLFPYLPRHYVEYIKDLCVQQRLARSAGDRPAGVRARAP